MFQPQLGDPVAIGDPDAQAEVVQEYCRQHGIFVQSVENFFVLRERFNLRLDQEREIGCKSPFY